MDTSTQNITPEAHTKFCKFCGSKIPEDAVLCTACGRQVEELHKDNSQPNIVINNSNLNQNTNTNINQNGMMVVGRVRNKWVALLLCLFLGYFGAHKFYEGKAGMGVLYIFTLGLCGIGCIVDFITLLFKPTKYLV